jgi:hypothetical protein
MAITQAMCTSFKSEILSDDTHDFLADTIKIALFTSSATLNATTTAYSTSNEISGTGYSAGSVSTNSDKAIAVLAFGGDFTVSGGTFQIVLPAAGSSAIIRID